MANHKKNAKPLTIKDIAELAGVSTATVSKVMNQKDDDIGENTRKKILDIIEEYNYIPYRRVIQRISAKSSTIGLVISDDQDAFSQQFVRGVEACAYKEKMSVIVCHADAEAERLKRYHDVLKERHVEGTIIVQSNRFDVDDVEAFHADGTPLVVIDQRAFDDDIESVFIDYERGAYMATQLLIEKGHETIGYIGESDESASHDPVSRQKLEGYKKALYDHNMNFNPNLVFEGSVKAGGKSLELKRVGYEGASFLAPLGVTAIVASDDVIANGVYTLANEQQLKIPQQLSVVGIGNSPICEFVFPALTSVSYPFYEMGYDACASLISKIQKQEIEKKLHYKPNLVKRDSVAYPRSKGGTPKERIVIVGSLNMDLIMRVPHIPRVGETVLATSIKTLAGGKGANQAVGAGKLGGKVSMIGRVGNDSYGRDLFNGLIKNGVDASGVIYDDVLPTGNANIYVAENGDNNIVVNPGANSRLSIEQVDSFESLFNKVSYCLIQMEIPMATIEHVAKICREKDIKLILNPAPAQEIDYEVFEGCYLVVPNETEIDLMVPGDLTIEEKAHELLNKGFENVIITLGEKGCLLVNEHIEKYFPAATFNVVDTTGAGDSFISGLTVALSEGQSMEEAIRFASIASGITVSREGAQPSLPDRESIEKYLKEGQRE